LEKFGAILAIVGEGLEKGVVRGKGEGRRIRRAEVNMTELVRTADKYRQVLTRRELRKIVRDVRTLYKKKGVKVLPANIPLPDGINPGGGVTWETGLEGKEGKRVPRGSRLTPERLKAMKVGEGFLSEKEKALFVEILYDYEGAIAFEDSEMGILNPEIEPPAKIHTIPHEPWQQQSLRLPKAMEEKATEIVKERLALGLLEHSQGPYRSRFFLVPKKQPGEYRLINDVQPLNGVTIRDSGMPPATDEFSEDFAGYPILTSIDYYSGYNQILLDLLSRDFTAFATLLGSLRQTRLPQGWTNSVAYFQRIICKVLWFLIPHYVRPFIDDIGIKGPTSRYNDEERSPGIRRFVWEHAQIFRTFMHATWCSGMTISGAKSCIGMPGITIVGMVCDAEGRHPEKKKVEKIVNWPVPRNVRDARSFIGIAVYYRIFIANFSVIAAPIFKLFKKGSRFRWDDDCQNAMTQLKSAMTAAPVLVKLDFSPNALPIVLNVDASTTIGWGAVLSQIQADGKVKPSRFESGIWNSAELKYDALKLECRGLLKALKKFRFWLFGRHFQVETDSQTLVWLLNQPPNDLPNAMMTRWLAYIRLFDFTPRHIPGKRNSVADGLSRRGAAPEDDDEDDDIDSFFDAKLYAIHYRSEPSAMLSHVYLLDSEYSGEDLVLGRYLETLERPSEIDDDGFRRLRTKAKHFFVRDGHLYKRSRKRGLPPRRVIGLRQQRWEIIKALHDDIGHRGKDATFQQVRRRYQWKGMYDDVADYCRTCEECQRRSRVRQEEPLHPTWSMVVFQKVGVDVVYMPESKEGFKYIVFARDDLSGWVEGRAITENTAAQVAKFLFEDVITRHGCPERIVVDGGPENKKVAQALLEHYKIGRTLVSPYHPQANGLVERGHAPIVDAISKYSDKAEHWPRHLHLALWADRISVRRSTGYTAFEMVYGRDCLLPIDFSIASWSIVDWEGEIRTREDLILARMRQLDEKNLTQIMAAEKLEASRKANKEWFDSHKRLRSDNQQLKIGDLVLQHQTLGPGTRKLSKKLENRWKGPYRIAEIPPDSTYYVLEELDGTRLRERTIAGNRIKKFFPRSDLDERRQEIYDTIRVTEPPEEGVEEREEEDVLGPDDDELLV
jgi:transposase InsO family protein